MAVDPEQESQRDPAAVAHLEPLDVDGVQTLGVGTVAWVVAFAALLPFHRTLGDQGRLWWLWTCGAGVLLGVVGVVYCRRRRAQLRSRPPETVETSTLGAAGL